ncbi:hypothetical protein [Paenibacillus sp. MMS20-IR301]|uniref:hypothetical protein n=1 Tax=Paenibacillus sp. MMS20-IR301 TaxID=2895946 RepID=UPI0028E8379C|nr:hypothetical protein [Paenibacillus sp. MMS20-IR301]WNS46076.1 hypothetical protein LOS79_12635 [Paenibacillus sp. MMS20-IR301]
MTEQHEMDQFLRQVQAIENTIHALLQKTQLSDEEKDYILRHILAVPVSNEETYIKNAG